MRYNLLKVIIITLQTLIKELQCSSQQGNYVYLPSYVLLDFKIISLNKGMTKWNHPKKQIAPPPQGINMQRKFIIITAKTWIRHDTRKRNKLYTFLILFFNLSLIISILYICIYIIKRLIDLQFKFSKFLFFCCCFCLVSI